MASYRILTKNDIRNHYFAIGEKTLKSINTNQPITLICNGKVYKNRNIDKSLGYGHLYAKKEFFEDNHLEVDDCLVFNIEETNTIRVILLKKNEIINIDTEFDEDSKDTSRPPKKPFIQSNKRAYCIEKKELINAISRKNTIDFIEPGLIPFDGSFGSLGKSVKSNSFLRYSSQNGIVLVTVDTDIEKLDRNIKQLKESPSLKNTNIRGILIKPYEKQYDEDFCRKKKMSINNSSIKVMYCKFDFRLQGHQVNSIPIKLSHLKQLEESHISDYFYDHLREIENNMHPYKGDYFGCREYEIKGRKIDLFCKDENNKPVVIEIKKRIESTYNSYDAVGQVLCYIRLAETEESLNDVRGIILIPKEATESYKKDIQLALECCQNCRKIDLLFYSVDLSFVE